MKPRVNSLTLLLVVAGWVSVIAAQTEPAPAPTASVWDGVYTAGQAKRGEPLYTTHCASCHMPDLLGNPTFPLGQPPAPRFTGIAAGSPSLRGSQFVSNWTGLTVKDVFERMRVSMPQNAPGTLSRQMNADILAFILFENGYPSGLQELPTTDAPLHDITIGPDITVDRPQPGVAVLSATNIRYGSLVFDGSLTRLDMGDQWEFRIRLFATFHPNAMPNRADTVHLATFEFAATNPRTDGSRGPAELVWEHQEPIDLELSVEGERKAIPEVSFRVPKEAVAPARYKGISVREAKAADSLAWPISIPLSILDTVFP
jgi:mono/diheme cytochrome c family protein